MHSFDQWLSLNWTVIIDRSSHERTLVRLYRSAQTSYQRLTVMESTTITIYLAISDRKQKTQCGKLNKESPVCQGSVTLESQFSGIEIEKVGYWCIGVQITDQINEKKSDFLTATMETFIHEPKLSPGTLYHRFIFVYIFMYFYSALGLLKVVTLGKFAEWTNCRSLKSLLE